MRGLRSQGAWENWSEAGGPDIGSGSADASAGIDAELGQEAGEQMNPTNAMITATPLDTAPAGGQGRFGDWRLDTLRELILHVLIETAVR